MKIDTKKIKELLSSGVTGYRVGKETDVKQQTFDKYKNGKSDIEDMSLKTAMELQKFINKEENEMRYTVVLQNLKNKVGTDIPIGSDQEIIDSTTLSDAFNAISHNLDQYNKGIERVEYLIYYGTKSDKSNTDFWSETNYSVSYLREDNDFEIQKISLAGLEYKGEVIQESEQYKIFFDTFEEFVDDVVYDLENEHGGLKTPQYSALEEIALDLLAKGEIYVAKKAIEKEVLNFNEIE